nr:immunoglobulin heavy chain junction region [Macaca mulatta]MOV43817.1 immunoglobulin heavy chain junction region [Macaca mulatta]MOV44481.1 immunoglobulin heavy chain junction region [Macaca mulatta]MOV46596.1 immunoglobulin heavy chain junction region [Macaca mulatta]MOV47203.1 immunoglobulin heavy chain junction region [Macaca mulatta]
CARVRGDYYWQYYFEYW